MPSTPLMIQGTTVANIPELFRAYSEVQPFTYRSGATYTTILESMRVWILDDLVPYLNTNFSDIQDNWDQNIQNIVDGINTALQNALNAIAASDVVITDPAIVAAYNAANSLSKALFDSRYASEVVVNNLAGIKLDGSADVATILNNAINALPAGSAGNLIVKPLAFGQKVVLRIDSMVTLDMAKAGLVTRGGLEIDASRIISGPAMKVTTSAAISNNSTPAGPALEKFRLMGPGRTVTASTGILFDSVTAGQVRGLATRDITVENFGRGNDYGANTYCIQHYNINIKGCDVAANFPTGTNSGERISYVGGTLSDSRQLVNMANGNGDVLFSDVSLDYWTETCIVQSNGLLQLQNCHVEGHSNNSTYWFQFHGGNFTMRDGIVTTPDAYNGTTSFPSIIYSDAPNTTGLEALFDGVTWNNVRTLSNRAATGTGPVKFRNSKNLGGATANFYVTADTDDLFADGFFEQSSIVDLIWNGADTGTINDASNTGTLIAGTNWNASLSTTIKKSGTQSLKVTKTGAAGSNCTIEFAAPLVNQQMHGTTVSLARHTAMTGIIFATLFYANLTGRSTTGGLPRRLKSQQISQRQINLATDLPSIDTWVDTVSQTFAVRAPAWATHIVLSFNLQPMSAGDLYFDELVATAY